MELFGIVLKKEIQLPALIALIVSCTTGFVQLHWALQGPNVSLLPIDQVYIGYFGPNDEPYSAGSGKDGYVRFGARMAYINTALPQYSAVIIRESAVISIDGVEFEHHWYQFTKNDPHSPRSLAYEDDVHPLMIIGSSVISHETLFTAYPVNCEACDDDVKFQHFLQWSSLAPLLASPSPSTFKFTFSATFYDGNKRLLQHCTLTLTPTLKTRLLTRGWIAPACAGPKDAGTDENTYPDTYLWVTASP